MELGALYQPRFFSCGGAVPAAVIALHRIVPTAPVRHSGDVGVGGYVKWRLCVQVYSFISSAIYRYICDTLNAHVFGQLVHTGCTAIGTGARPGIAHNDAAADKEIFRLRGGQQHAGYTGLSCGSLILVIVRRAAFNRAGVALARVLQPDHGKLPLDQVAARAAVLRPAGAPFGDVCVMAAVIERRQARAAGDVTVGIQPRCIGRVADVGVDFARAVSALRPCVIACGGAALHFEVAVTILVPLAGVCIFLQRPAQVCAAAYLVIAVDKLDGIDGVAAVCGLLGGHKDAPKLRQVRKVVLFCCCLGAWGTGKPRAVVRQLADGRLACGK